MQRLTVTSTQPSFIQDQFTVWNGTAIHDMPDSDSDEESRRQARRRAARAKKADDATKATTKRSRVAWAGSRSLPKVNHFRRRRAPKPKSSLPVPAAYTQPVVTSGALASVARSALNPKPRKAALMPPQPKAAGVEDNTLLGMFSPAKHPPPPSHGSVIPPTLPGSTSVGTLDPVAASRGVPSSTAVRGLPKSLQMFWGRHPEAGPLRSALAFRPPARADHGDAAGPLIAPDHPMAAHGLAGTAMTKSLSMTALKATSRRAGVPLEQTMQQVGARPEGPTAPVVMPPLIQAALESHFQALVAADPLPPKPTAMQRMKGITPDPGPPGFGATVSALASPALGTIRAAQAFHGPAARLQATFKAAKARREFQLMRATALSLQCWYRRRLARQLRKNILAAKAAVAKEMVQFAVALSVMMPIGREWHAHKTERRLRRVCKAWFRTAHGRVHGRRMRAVFDRNLLNITWIAFSRTTRADARLRKGLACLAFQRDQRIKKKCVDTLLKNAEIRVFVRWKRRRVHKKIKWKAFRGFVDALRRQRKAVVVIQRKTREYFRRKKARAMLRLGIGILGWVGRLRYRKKLEEAREMAAMYLQKLYRGKIQRRMFRQTVVNAIERERTRQRLERRRAYLAESKAVAAYSAALAVSRGKGKSGKKTKKTKGGDSRKLSSDPVAAAVAAPGADASDEVAALTLKFKKAAALVKKGGGLYGWGKKRNKKELDSRRLLAEAAAKQKEDAAAKADPLRSRRRRDSSFDKAAPNPFVDKVTELEAQPQDRADELFVSKREAKLRARWDLLDVDGVGQLRRDELRILLEDVLGEGRYSDDDMDALIRRMDGFRATVQKEKAEKAAAAAAARGSRDKQPKPAKVSPTTTSAATESKLDGAGAGVYTDDDDDDDDDDWDAPTRTSPKTEEEKLEREREELAARLIEWDDFVAWWQTESRSSRRCVPWCPFGGGMGPPDLSRVPAQNRLSRVRNDARRREIALFRRAHRPRLECERCGRAFAMYSEYSSHRCIRANAIHNASAGSATGESGTDSDTE